MTDQAETAIVALHAFFQKWMADGEGDFAEFTAVMATEFQMITPDGNLVSRESLLPQIEGLKADVPNIRFEISDVVLLASSAEACVARYIETQITPEGHNSRWATATFRIDTAVPHGLLWTSLQETWINEK